MVINKVYDYAFIEALLKYIIETMGCQMNVCDSVVLDSALSTCGALKVNNISNADVVIVNTCSVRAQSEQKALSYIGRIERFKYQNPNIRIIVIGCMAERIGSKIQGRFKGVDLILGSKDIDKITLKILRLCGLNSSLEKQKIFQKTEVVKHVTVVRGCDNYCSYCVVPFVRGKEESIDHRIIFDECSSTVRNGTKEIVLLGQNVNSYSYDCVNFVGLVKKIASIENLKRIRFMTNHPKDLSDELINLMVNEPKMCSHIHLPMQSASDKILKMMNRNYSFEQYLILINKLRIAIPDINITTDIIVGFPSETEKDFKSTLDAVKSIKFGGVYVFKYSPRPNTKAAAMVDSVSLEDKKTRHAIILEESNKISAEIVSKMIGSVQNVLAEKVENGVMEARTRSFHKVFIRGDANVDYLGKQLNVNIVASKVSSLGGLLIKKSSG
jgi:tRNA-2-methylthio-N6-dimethylallyladenosine synthase